MPRRNDIQKILLIGSGPIIIGQACEFDYSGTQACKALREEGYEVVLINSNPATIMTDPEMADRTYIEPLTWEIVAKVIEAERPDALLPTLGGQTGLNLAMDLSKHGVLEEYHVEMIGTNAQVIAKAEERDQFRLAMQKIGLEVCQGRTVHSLEEGRQVLQEIGLPAVVRPGFTLGGTGSSIAYNREAFDELVNRGLNASPIHEVLLEESVLGWKEYEMEVMRDTDDNVVIICSIENFDPMGVHTGDSITVAPAQTLTDKEPQRNAPCLDRRHSRDRRGDRRFEHPICDSPPNRPDGGDRDEPPRQPFQRFGFQGHGVPHCEDCCEARRRLPSARIAQ